MKKILLEIVDIFLPPKSEKEKKYRKEQFWFLTIFKIWMILLFASSVFLLITLILI
jgi:hypothetical protein